MRTFNSYFTDCASCWENFFQLGAHWKWISSLRKHTQSYYFIPDDYRETDLSLIFLVWHLILFVQPLIRPDLENIHPFLCCLLQKCKTPVKDLTVLREYTAIVSMEMESIATHKPFFCILFFSHFPQPSPLWSLNLGQGWSFLCTFSVLRNILILLVFWAEKKRWSPLRWRWYHGQ